jgi:hypothetical protein
VILVAGTNSRVTISNASLRNCCLVVEKGAHATLLNTSFTMHGEDSKNIGVVVRGDGSRVTLNECSFIDCRQVGEVSLGATLAGRSLRCHGGGMGFHVSDSSSRLELRDCTISGTSPATGTSARHAGDVNTGAGVLATLQAECILERCDFWGGGIHASDASIHLNDNRIVNCYKYCCSLKSCTSARVEECMFEGSSDTGLIVSNCPDAVVKKCSFAGHVSFGLKASENAQVVLTECNTGSCDVGYKVCQGSHAVITGCSSSQDGTGFSIEGEDSSALIASSEVTQCSNTSVLIMDAEAELEECRLEGYHGIYAIGSVVSVRSSVLVGIHAPSLVNTGFVVIDGTSVTVQDTLFTGYEWMGVHVQGTNSSAELRGCDISGCLGAVCSREGGRLVAHDCKLGAWIQSSHVIGKDTFLELHSCVLKVGQPELDPAECFIVGNAAASSGGHMAIHNCHTISSGKLGILGVGEGTTVFVSGGTVQGRGVVGVSALEGAVIEVARLVVSTPLGTSFRTCQNGQLYLSECVSEQGEPYCDDEGGVIVCDSCFPEDTSRLKAI